MPRDNKENVHPETTEEVVEEIVELDEVEQLQAQIKEWEEKYMRLAAEYDNYQKRTQREKESRYADAVIDTSAQILDIADNLERATSVEVESEDAKKVIDGVLMITKQMSDTLNKLGITPIDAVGEEFDPKLHNAVMHVDDDSVADNTIVEEFMKGYIYKSERVVRHSMVKVAN